MPRIIAIASPKGGVGKTTTCYALGSILAGKGRSVLMIDLDPQASLSASCGVKGNPGITDVLNSKSSLSETVRWVAPHLSLIAADRRLADTEIQFGLMDRITSINVLKRALQDWTTYGFVLLDMPPSLGLLSANGLMAADDVLIPARPDYLGQNALILIMNTIHTLQTSYNYKLRVIGILPTFYNPRTLHHTKMIQAWHDARLPVLDIFIKQSIRVAEAPVAKQSIVDYAPSSSIAESYKQLAEVIDRR